MRNVSFFALLALSASSEAGSANPFDGAPLLNLDGTVPATDTAPAKLPRAPRKPRSVKAATDTTPAPVEPVNTDASNDTAETSSDATPVEPVTDAPADVTPEAEPAVRLAPIARTCATIARQATNFGGVLSDRDNAYITFYAYLARQAADGIVTVRAIADSGMRPNYSGSSKPHDAGVIVRLTKAGIITPEADGTSFHFTARAKTLKAYAAA